MILITDSNATENSLTMQEEVCNRPVIAETERSLHIVTRVSVDSAMAELADFNSTRPVINQVIC